MSNKCRNLEADFCTSTAEKMKFSIKNVHSKCDQFHRKPRKTADLITFAEENLIGLK